MLNSAIDFLKIALLNMNNMIKKISNTFPCTAANCFLSNLDGKQSFYHPCQKSQTLALSKVYTDEYGIK